MSELDFYVLSADTLPPYREYMRSRVRYPCTQCRYTTTIQRIYTKVRFPCTQCEYTTATANHLRKHISIQHLKEGYQWDLCEYAAT